MARGLRAAHRENSSISREPCFPGFAVHRMMTMRVRYMRFETCGHHCRIESARLVAISRRLQHCNISALGNDERATVCHGLHNGGAREPMRFAKTIKQALFSVGISVATSCARCWGRSKKLFRVVQFASAHAQSCHLETLRNPSRGVIFESSSIANPPKGGDAKLPV